MTYQLLSDTGGSLGEGYQTLAIAVAFAKTANGMLGTPVHIIDVDDEEEIITIGDHAHQNTEGPSTQTSRQQNRLARHRTNPASPIPANQP